MITGATKKRYNQACLIVKKEAADKVMNKHTTRTSKLHSYLLNVIFVEAAVQSGAGEAQFFGCFADVAVVFFDYF